MLRITPRRWTSQPQFATGIDWSNPITRGIDIAFPDIGSPSIVGSAKTTAVGAPTSSLSPFGVGRKFATASDLYNTSGWPTLPDGTEYTLLCVYCQTSVGALDFLASGDNNSSFREFQFRIETTGAPTLIGFNTAVSTFSVSGVAGAVGSTQTIVARNSASSVALFQNGVKRGSTAFTGTIKGHTDTWVTFGNRSGVFLHGSIGLFVRWPRALSDAEAASLSANPWQIFSPALC